MSALSLNTQLKDRVLWFDGDSSYQAADLIKVIDKQIVRFVDDVTNPLVQQYNKHVPKSQEIATKQQCRQLDLTWNVPDKYKNLDLTEYVISKHIEITHDIPVEQAEMRDLRILEELAEYQLRGLSNMLKAIIYIIETLDANNVVRGVGRGSSVSSYVLYVIGVHDVDSFEYGLEIGEFLHE